MMTVTSLSSPWHEGEITMQKRLGVSERMGELGQRVIRDYMPEQHRDFFALLPMVVLGAVDRGGNVWATLRAGWPGFLHAPDPHQLRAEIRRDPADPAEDGMEDGEAIAMLGIDPATRRRNRLNGILHRSGPEAFAVEVEQSFGNCPQYIQKRHSSFLRDPGTASTVPAVISHRLDDRAHSIVAAADTFYVATYVERDGRRQVDVSHRGGRSGFVRVDDDGVLTIPEFAGNQFFNTLGNMVANPRAGLAFVDFATGDLLQMSGRVEVVHESPEIAAFQGAERLLRFQPETLVFRAGALPLQSSLAEDGWSPKSLMTGSWGDAAARLRTAVPYEAPHSGRVARLLSAGRQVRDP
jgi:predicted pyridoxine 5'-phosphate oxidase superfamily flavin-nucleotide-binding protein